MLIPLLLFALSANPGATMATTDPPVRVWFNDDGKYLYGDRARVYVRAAKDGYLVVLRSDARGNVRVLSPVDPDDDQQIHGGKKYEAKGRGGREAFVVEDTSGQGVVLAAWSRTPFDLARYERNAHWDVQALGDTNGERSASRQDPETRLLSVVDAMAPGGHYQYDAATYVVYSPRLARAAYAYPYPYWWNGGWWGYNPWWGGPVFGPRVVFVPGRFGFRRRW
jgi:uncharacterized protein DUF4384